MTETSIAKHGEEAQLDESGNEILYGYKQCRESVNTAFDSIMCDIEIEEDVPEIAALKIGIANYLFQKLNDYLDGDQDDFRTSLIEEACLKKEGDFFGVEEKTASSNS